MAKATTLDTTFTHIGFRVYKSHDDLVKEAARRKGLSVAEYCRGIILEFAASDCGRPSIDVRMYAAGDVVRQAAKRMGISPRQLVANATRELAIRELQKN